MKKPITAARASACLAALIPGTAYAAAPADHNPRIETMLAAAGFRSIPDTSPAVASIIATAPFNKLHAVPAGSEFNYVFVDPQGCGCVLEGNEAAYQQYQALDIQQRTAELNSSDAFGRPIPPVLFGGWGWDAAYGYGPFGYGYGPFAYGDSWSYAPIISLHFGGGEHRR
jgi:hypothetical protein